MAFQLRNNETVRKGVKRLVRKQIDKALAGLRAGNESDRVVHEARKCFKRIRAVLRLVRDELGDKVYRAENTCIRDAGRPLTEIRDAKVLMDALENLTTHFGDEVKAGSFAAVRAMLLTDKKAIRKRVLKEQHAFSNVTVAVEAARGRIRDWTIRSKGWAALQNGLKTVYKDGCQALAVAARKPTMENLHEWRKQAKYLWHQLQVLEPLWTPMMKELGNQVHELTRLLGDDHDLAVLDQKIAADPAACGGGSIVETLRALIDRRRAELEQETFSLAQRVYLDKPNTFLNRIQGYWKAWRSEVPADRAGV
jgi:CHAD domain-containing protein